MAYHSSVVVLDSDESFRVQESTTGNVAIDVTQNNHGLTSVVCTVKQAGQLANALNEFLAAKEEPVETTQEPDYLDNNDDVPF